MLLQNYDKFTIQIDKISHLNSKKSESTYFTIRKALRQNGLSANHLLGGEHVVAIHHTQEVNAGGLVGKVDFGSGVGNRLFHQQFAVDVEHLQAHVVEAVEVAAHEVGGGVGRDGEEVAVLADTGIAGGGDGDVVNEDVAGEVGHGIRIHKIHDVNIIAHIFRIEKSHKGHLVGGGGEGQCYRFLRPVGGVGILLEVHPLCGRRGAVHHVEDLGRHHGSLLAEEGEGGLVARAAEVHYRGDEVGGFAPQVLQLSHHRHQLHHDGKGIVAALADVEEVAEERAGVGHTSATGMMFAHDAAPHICADVGLGSPIFKTVFKTGGVRVAVGDHDLCGSGTDEEAHQKYCTKNPTNCIKLFHKIRGLVNIDFRGKFTI